MKFLPTLLIAGLLAGCSTFGRLTDVTNLVDYSNHKSVKVLEIPSDLDAPNFDKTYVTSISDSMGATKPGRLDQVPLVDKSMGAPPRSSVKIVKKGDQSVLQVEGALATVWTRANVTLKSMGMTISKADQASGMIVARDRSLVADSASPVGRFLNKSLGKVNQGAEYQFRISGDGKVSTIEAADKVGKALPAADAQLILNRIGKEYTS